MLSFKTLNAAIEEQNRKNTYNGVITIYAHGQVIFNHAYGYANRSELIPNRLNTRFGIASGGKIFTAAAIGRLVQEGKLSFDTPVVGIVSAEFPSLSDKVLVRHLINHTSGIADYFDEEELDDYEAFWLDKPVYTMKQARDFLPLMTGQPAKFPPGEKFAYNNGAFILAGLVVEKISGMVFQDYIETNVFGPAYMRASGYFRTDQLPQHTALGYIDDGDSWRSNIFAIPIRGHGDGGPYTTTADMNRFWSAFFGKRYFKDEVLQTMLTPQIKVSEDGVFQYGLGCWISDAMPARAYYVVGEDPGVEFYSGYFPDVDLQITLTANANGALWDMVKIIREEIFGLSPTAG